MPEYLAPGVFVEETSFRSKSIEGVSTTTTGFVGPTRFGPVDLPNEIITSVGEFERTFGNRRRLVFASGSSRATLHNYTWHGVRAFFEEGGKRLYVSRTFRRNDDATYLGIDASISVTSNPSGYADGHARALLEAGASDPKRTLAITARYPGAAGNLELRFTLRVGQNVLSFDQLGKGRVGGLNDRDVVMIRDTLSPIGSPPGSGEFYIAAWNTVSRDWDFTPDSGQALHLSNFQAADGLEIRILTLAVTATDDEGTSITWDGVALDKGHTVNGLNDSLYERFRYHADDPTRGAELPIVVNQGNLEDGLDVLSAFLSASVARGGSPLLELELTDPDSTEDARSLPVVLEGGNDGMRPTADEYAGLTIPNSTRRTGLLQFEDVEDISIVAAPGSTFGYENGYNADGATITNLLISHCERMRYRIAVLDSGNGQTIAQVRAMRARLDSKYAALYYPWVKVLDPVTREQIFLPPSGFVSGIYARNDVNRAVYKAPANEVVNLALGFEHLLNKAQQEVLNPEGINAFRFFEGRGFRLWGARTVSSDPEWKYVNLRRYFAYLERSIDKGTQWAVFEPNGEALWANVRRTVEDFLLNEWQSGALLGDKPEKAYFVKCDRSTMTQNDLDNGRLICLIGVSPLRPAEFVVFRIGQWTADAKK
ncbi:MAG TPA: phage tail sheath subtilisin-like domain-containing protein [Polyangiaceae bacterium]